MFAELCFFNHWSVFEYSERFVIKKNCQFKKSDRQKNFDSQNKIDSQKMFWQSKNAECLFKIASIQDRCKLNSKL
jgi:hypothetical protein